MCDADMAIDGCLSTQTGQNGIGTDGGSAQPEHAGVFQRHEARLLLWGIVYLRFINICVTATTSTP
jgi:hypothetical protein